MNKIAGTLVFLFIMTGLAWASGSGMSSTGSDPQQMLDFNLAGYGAQGQKTWEVEGASMDILGDNINISDMRAKLYGNAENMTLTADSGQFDKQTGIVHLRDNVHAITESGAHLKTDVLTSVGVLFGMLLIKLTNINKIQCIFSSCSNTDNYILEFSIYSNNKLRITQKNNDTDDIISGSSILTVDTWYHVVFTSDGDNYIIYLNTNLETLSVISGYNKGDWFGDTTHRKNISIGMSKKLNFNYEK